MELLGRLYDSEQAVRIEISAGRVARVVPLEVNATPSRGLDQWPWIAPALVDLQANGYGGQEFSSAELTEEKVANILRAFEQFGVTRICPTVTTEGFAILSHALATIASLCESSPSWARRMPGIHLEGPYITSQDGARGAHPKKHCRRPDWDEFQRLQEAAGGRIRILTMSPEFDGSPAFIEQVAATGVVVAIGHTSARPEQIRAAVDAGARMSTHLGNGSHPTLHRFRNSPGPRLAGVRPRAGLMVDGHPWPPDRVKVFARAKPPGRGTRGGDISGQAGQPPGRYTTPFCDVEILPNGGLVVAGQREIMAGASLPVSVGVANVMRFAGIDLKTAVRMAAHHPARLLGLEPIRIAPDQPANLFPFHLPPETGEGLSPGLRWYCTVAEGEVVWGVPWQPA